MVERLLYAHPRLASWAQKELPTLESTWNIEEAPAEQLDALLATYSVGDALVVGQQFKCLVPIGSGIWSLKTADLRMFGWFWRRDCFIGSAAAETGKVKHLGLYRGYISQAVRDRDLLDLDEPKYITGNNPNDVVSNSHLP